MAPRARRLVLPAFLLPTLFLLLAAAHSGAQITVAAAASVRYAMEELTAAYAKKTGFTAKAVYGASGALVSQIRNGAPFDVFVSADTEFADSLKASGKGVGDVRLYGYGTLVLWTLREDLDPRRGVALVLDPSVARVALADVKRAPYGREAAKALRKAGLYDSAQAKLVFGENISQVSQYVLTRNADVGFNAKSVVVAKEVEGKGRWAEVDPSLYDPIAQGALVTLHGRETHPRESKAFLKFLLSGEGRRILAAYGYALP